MGEGDDLRSPVSLGRAGRARRIPRAETELDMKLFFTDDRAIGEP